MTAFAEAKSHAHGPRHVPGRAAEARDRRCGGGAGQGACLGRRQLLHAASQPQRDRAARRHAGVAWRRPDRARRHAGRRAHGLVARHVFGIDEKQVHVTSPFVGGGFGSKTLWQHQVLGAAAAKLAGRPVRIALSREGVYRLVGGRTVTEQRVAIGAEADGRFTAIIHTGTVAMTRTTPCRSRSSWPAGAYAADSFKLDVEVAYMDMLANTLHARAGRGGRHVRAGMRGGRAGDQAADGSDRAAHPQRAREGPDRRDCRSPRGTRWKPGGRAPSASAGAAQPGARRSARGRVAGRHGLRHRTYPYYRMPGGAARITLTKDGRATGRRGRARDGHGHRDRADPGRRRAARAGDGPGRLSTTATPLCPAWCWPAVRSRPRPSAPR